LVDRGPVRVLGKDPGSRSQSPHAEGGLGAIADLELGEGVRHVVPDGLEPLAEVAGDLGVGVSGADAEEELRLPSGEVVRPAASVVQLFEWTRI